jgi:hypothetical protein
MRSFYQPKVQSLLWRAIISVIIFIRIIKYVLLNMYEARDSELLYTIQKFFRH